jgi:hypothetical protein
LRDFVRLIIERPFRAKDMRGDPKPTVWVAEWVALSWQRTTRIDSSQRTGPSRCNLKESGHPARFCSDRKCPIVYSVAPSLSGKPSSEKVRRESGLEIVTAGVGVNIEHSIREI